MCVPAFCISVCLFLCPSLVPGLYGSFCPSPSLPLFSLVLVRTLLLAQNGCGGSPKPGMTPLPPTHQYPDGVFYDLDSCKHPSYPDSEGASGEWPCPSHPPDLDLGPISQMGELSLRGGCHLVQQDKISPGLQTSPLFLSHPPSCPCKFWGKTFARPTMASLCWGLRVGGAEARPGF